MNKIIGGLLGTALAVGGLGAATATTTTGAHGAEPYPGTVSTTTTATFPKSIRKGHKITIKAVVRASGSPPSGTVTFVVRREEGNAPKYKKSKSYTGSQRAYTTPKLTKRGRWLVTVKFTPRAGSVYKPSKTDGVFTVRRPRH